MESEDNMSLRVASFSCYLDPAKENLIHRISAGENSLVMSSGNTKSPSIKSPFPANFSQLKDGQDGLKSLRTDSFSYVKTAGENFVFKVPAPIQDPTSAFTFSEENSKDGEISVFGADRYFNMKLEYATGAKHEYKKDGTVNLARVGSNVNPSTRSVCSEANSWNSHTVLLQNIERNNSQTKKKKSIGRRFFAGLGCQVPCCDKKNVRANEIVSQGTCNTPKASRTASKRMNHLQAIPKHGTEQNFTHKKKLAEEKLEEGRNSIEVFGSNISSSKGDIVTNLERKLSMLTWDAIPKGQNQLPTSTIGTSTICDDLASDASSDLFEIENISGSINQILASKTEQDDVSCCMSPTTSHYAPSEVSIQWSVVTASAADYSSVLSDAEERSVSIAGERVSRKNVTNTSSRNRNGEGQEAQKIRPSGLLGCKTQKSVDVAETVCHKIKEKVKP